MNNSDCKHGSTAPAGLLKRLSESQGGPGRHKCGVCAYSRGFALAGSRRFKSLNDYNAQEIEFYECKHNRLAPVRLLKNLPEGQGGSSRHKCVTCAFVLGFKAGLISVDPDDMQITELEAPSYSEEKNKGSNNRKPNFEAGSAEALNVYLGDLGEKTVISFERKILIDKGRGDLAKKVEQVSSTVGDHLGYDVLSFYPTGEEKWIEVKTTTKAQSSKFHISENQIKCSETAGDKFWLYRLYDFDPEKAATSLYRLQGNLRDQLILDPTNYRARPK